MPEFINEVEEEYLINKVNDSSRIKWVYLSNRRLQNWGGIVHKKGLIQEDLPNVNFVFNKDLNYNTN